ncbi:hypothetical protein D3C84_841840 [compost metagenome]
MEDAQGAQAVVFDLSQLVQGGVGTAIVDDNDFIRFVGQRLAHLFKQRLEIVRFVLRRNQYRYKYVLAHGVPSPFWVYRFQRRTFQI